MPVNDRKDAMTDDAYAALETLSRGQGSGDPGLDPWISAFRTVQWVTRGETGYKLTAAGRQAYDEMRRDRTGVAPAALRPKAVATQEPPQSPNRSPARANLR